MKNIGDVEEVTDSRSTGTFLADNGERATPLPCSLCSLTTDNF